MIIDHASAGSPKGYVVRHTFVNCLDDVIDAEHCDRATKKAEYSQESCLRTRKL